MCAAGETVFLSLCRFVCVELSSSLSPSLSPTLSLSLSLSLSLPPSLSLSLPPSLSLSLTASVDHSVAPTNTTMPVVTPHRANCSSAEITHAADTGETELDMRPQIAYANTHDERYMRSLHTPPCAHEHEP